MQVQGCCLLQQSLVSKDPVGQPDQDWQRLSYLQLCCVQSKLPLTVGGPLCLLPALWLWERLLVLSAVSLLLLGAMRFKGCHCVAQLFFLSLCKCQVSVSRLLFPLCWNSWHIFLRIFCQKGYKQSRSSAQVLPSEGSLAPFLRLEEEAEEGESLQLDSLQMKNPRRKTHRVVHKNLKLSLSGPKAVGFGVLESSQAS